MKRFLKFILGLFGWHPKPRLELEEDAKLRWQRLHEDIGAFDYDEDGFSYPFETGTGVVRWSDVDRIVGYKLDLFATDEICIELQVGDRSIRFSESTPGWYQFLERLRKVFPGVPEGWDWDVAMPPFATNYTFLYERHGGNLPATYNFYGSVRPVPFSIVVEAFEEEGWMLRGTYADTMDVVNGWSEIHLIRHRKGVMLTGRIDLRSGRAEDIDRVLYGIGEPFQYEFYDAEKKPIRERRWP